MGLFMRPSRALMRIAAAASTDGARDSGASPVPTGTTGELESLAEMHESGAPSEAELAAVKARLLGP